ncbi:hypothetical protein AXG93_763s1410 [Marchantia polymorpha subsp. ruderalis]|uniref:Uncharacterized protein n=1 Tax=Marchantia polymorpha subsp. ruderalis TaxID=1480154 RepID=A0A176WPS3_MARPO|nr:hypothetical protein AXG93_763s1410 [Marchantia polymorpha subsp. ruderalis]
MDSDWDYYRTPNIESQTVQVSVKAKDMGPVVGEYGSEESRMQRNAGHGMAWHGMAVWHDPGRQADTEHFLRCLYQKDSKKTPKMRLCKAFEFQWKGTWAKADEQGGGGGGEEKGSHVSHEEQRRGSPEGNLDGQNPRVGQSPTGRGRLGPGPTTGPSPEGVSQSRSSCSDEHARPTSLPPQTGGDRRSAASNPFAFSESSDSDRILGSPLGVLGYSIGRM